MVRADGRRWNESRPANITLNHQKFAEGSALIEVGNTKVLCAVSLEERVPAFLRGQGKGWVTAEYAMLPRSTNTRTARDRDAGRINGRSQEIQRLIGRSLRAVTDLEALGERTVTVDCDVIQVQPTILKEETLYQQFNKVHKNNVLENCINFLPPTEREKFRNYLDIEKMGQHL